MVQSNNILDLCLLAFSIEHIRTCFGFGFVRSSSALQYEAIFCISSFTHLEAVFWYFFSHFEANVYLRGGGAKIRNSRSLLRTAPNLKLVQSIVTKLMVTYGILASLLEKKNKNPKIVVIMQ